MLERSVKRAIVRNTMLSPGDHVLVAVSGGPDSVCLLHVLSSLSQELGISLHVAHLDHRFRSQESADDAAFVGALAARFGFPATIEAFDVPSYCKERGLSAQEGARKVRYDFLQRTATKIGAVRIATGHTADDQSETLLMRLIRGAGVSGLSSIPPTRDNIIRPLIAVTRAEVLQYLQDNGLTYRTDPSNLKPVYTRNRIRTEILPALAKLNPRIVETLAATAGLLRDEDRAVEDHLSILMKKLANRHGDTYTVPRIPFLALPAAFQRRLLRNIVREFVADVSAAGLPLDQSDAALEFLRVAQTGRAMSLPGGIAVTREYDRFLFHAVRKPERFSYPLAVPGSVQLDGLGLTVNAEFVQRKRSSAVAGNGTSNGWQAVFDHDKLRPSSTLSLRSRLPGDRFRPSGMGGRSRKLQDFFVDRKVPARMRDRIPLLVSGNDILWVIGHRTDIRFLPGPKTKRLLAVTVQRTSDDT